MKLDLWYKQNFWRVDRQSIALCKTTNQRVEQQPPAIDFQRTLEWIEQDRNIQSRKEILLRLIRA
jgi:hypothetical protein